MSNVNSRKMISENIFVGKLVSGSEGLTCTVTVRRWPWLVLMQLKCEYCARVRECRHRAAGSANLCTLQHCYRLVRRTREIFCIAYCSKHTVVAKTVTYFHFQYFLKLVLNRCFVLLNYSCKSNFKIRDGFGICRS